MASGPEKLRHYEGAAGWAHGARAALAERWGEWREQWGAWRATRARLLSASTAALPPRLEDEAVDYSHIYRRKTAWELARVSAAVAGIEFAYAAETAFVAPALLKMRVGHGAVALAWALSPTLGFFLTPLLGSLSDRCRLRLGRRRPFIALLGVGVLVGLLLVPNGEWLGHLMGDPVVMPNATAVEGGGGGGGGGSGSGGGGGGGDASDHRWGVFLTVLGTVLLDFDADACQSPARAYLLDVTVAEDHARGLSAFTLLAGLGGGCGYMLGSLDWDTTALGRALGGHVRAVFSLVTVIFVVCILLTITSFREMPLDLIDSGSAPGPQGSKYETLSGENDPVAENGHIQLQETSFSQADSGPQETKDGTAGAGAEAEPGAPPTLRQYLLSIVFMPWALRMLCLTNLFCWMAHVCYSLYFTDYVGEAVFGGDPKAEEGTPLRLLYEEGVRFGCSGMAAYSLSCAAYSLVIERLIRRFRARRVYIGGLLTYSCGMALMAICCHRAAVILFSWTAGVMYSTLFTMPYLLVAHYHELNTFSDPSSDGGGVWGGAAGQRRGLGTDVAIVSSMVFLAQLLLSCGMGFIVDAAGTTTAVVATAAALAACAAVAASRVTFLDL